MQKISLYKKYKSCSVCKELKIFKKDFYFVKINPAIETLNILLKTNFKDSNRSLNSQPTTHKTLSISI